MLEQNKNQRTTEFDFIFSVKVCVCELLLGLRICKFWGEISLRLPLFLRMIQSINTFRANMTHVNFMHYFT